MKIKTFLVLALVGILAACAPVAQDTRPASFLPPTINSTPTQSTSPIPTPLPSPTLTQTLSPPPDQSDETVLLPSPDDQWKVILDRDVGSLEVEDVQGVKQSVFPPGSTVGEAKWSPDSRRLAVVLSHLPEKPDQGQSIELPEIRLITFEGGAFREAEPGYMAGEASGGQIVLGAWSPDSCRLLFWSGPLSASIKADGLPLWVLDTESMQATRLSETTLINQAYQSWSPDGSALVFTDGGYRSAQLNKWLSLYEVVSGQVTTLIPEDELVPGQVTWSPAGEAIAFAAVKAGQTGDEWADWMGWDNPAIQARRIYLLDPSSGNYRRMNTAEAYQDAPRWSADGKRLYYVQIDGDQAVIMSGDPATGEAQSVHGCQMPLPSRAGYYGQVDWIGFYENCTETTQSYIRNQKTMIPTLELVPTSTFIHSVSSNACLLAQLPANGETPWDTRRFDWAPDDSALAYVEPKNAQTGFLTLAFSPSFENTRRLASSVVGDISWSPDNTHIAYIALRPDDIETVMTINTNGTDLQDWFPGDAARTDTGTGSKHIVSWIDNSNLLLKTHCGTGCQRLWELHLHDGSLDEIQFFDQAKYDIWGSDYIFSPDQSHVVFVSGGDLQIGISSISDRTVSWISGEFGGKVKTIFADWSPDSSSILFLRFIQGEDGIPLHQSELWVWNVIANKEIQILPDVIAASWSKSEGMIAVLSLGEPTLGIDGKWQGTTAKLEGPNLLTLSLYNLQEEQILTSSTIGKVDIGYHWSGQIQQQILIPVWSPNDEYLAYRDASGNA